MADVTTDRPKDFVISSGVQYSVREFISLAASNLGIELSFSGEGLEEHAYVKNIQGKDCPALKGR